MKYIIFLSDVNELYKFALSMYDLSLVILIAQHSQKVCHYSISHTHTEYVIN